MKTRNGLSACVLAITLFGVASLFGQSSAQNGAQREVVASNAAAAPLQQEDGRKLIDDLKKQMDEKALAAQKYAGEWGYARWTTSMLLIVLSAIVAASKSIEGLFTNVPKSLKVAIPICAIIVGIMTSFDQSVKPGIRWRMSGTYVAHFRALKVKAGTIDPTDRAAINEVSGEFTALNQKWLEDTTF